MACVNMRLYNTNLNVYAGSITNRVLPMLSTARSRTNIRKGQIWS
jgi:hypothetical protein